MADADRGIPIFVFAPFVASTMRVEPAWIDYNGHMNMAYYLVLFDRAVDEAFEVVGLGQDYLESRGASYFTAEIHTRYLRELSVGTAVRTTVQLIDYDQKRIQAYFEIRHLEEGWTAATCEKLFLHVDMASRKVAPFPADILAGLATLKAAHGRLPRPAALGRCVSFEPQVAAPSRTQH